jgi:hypothetical protein
VRVTHISDGAHGAALAVTAPVTYESDRFVSRMTRPGSRTLVIPNILLYFPCIRLPVLAEGTVEVPTHVVSWSAQATPIAFEGTSPFEGVLDVYDVEHLSLRDSENPPADIVAYAVDRRIPGAVLAPATAFTYVS